MFSGTDDCVHVDDAMRRIAHHLLHICSKDGAFSHLASGSVSESQELYMELGPLLAAKKELGDGNGLADQLLKYQY